MQKSIHIAIIHPFDPFGAKIGGIERHISGFITKAPSEINLTMVGCTEDNKRRVVGKLTKEVLDGKTFFNYPVCVYKHRKGRPLIPDTLAFTLGLTRHRLDYSGMILQFHRIEPSVVSPVKNKKILFIHGDISDFYNRHNPSKWAKMPSLYFFIERHIIQRMAMVFVQNENGVAFYKRTYPYFSERFAFFPSWVDDAVFYPLPIGMKKAIKSAFLKERNLDSSRRILLFAGRLESQKDPFLLMRTFEYVHSRDPKTILAVVGTGPLKSHLIDYAKRNHLLDSVLFLGALPQAEVAEIMRLSDLFIMTSSFEGMPYAVVEALASGLPAVSTDVGSVSRAIVDRVSGRLVRSRAPEVIGDAALSVLDDKATYSQEKCTSAIRSFTASNVLNEIYKFYQRIAFSDDCSAP